MYSSISIVDISYELLFTKDGWWSRMVLLVLLQYLELQFSSFPYGFPKGFFHFIPFLKDHKAGLWITSITNDTFKALLH